MPMVVESLFPNSRSALLIEAILDKLAQEMSINTCTNKIFFYILFSILFLRCILSGTNTKVCSFISFLQPRLLCRLRAA